MDRFQSVVEDNMTAKWGGIGAISKKVRKNGRASDLDCVSSAMPIAPRKYRFFEVL